MTSWTANDHTGVFLVRTTCSERVVDSDSELDQGQVKKWNELVEATPLLCDVFMLAEMQDYGSTDRRQLIHDSLVSLPETQLFPCSKDTVFAWTDPQSSYLVSLANCYMSLSDSRRLPMTVVEHVADWQVTGSIDHHPAVLFFAFDLTVAKEAFFKHELEQIRTSVNDTSSGNSGKDIPLDGNQSTFGPEVQSFSLPHASKREYQDDILLSLRDIVQSELDDINNILTAIAAVAFVLISCFIWAVFHLPSSKSGSSNSGVSVKAITTDPSKSRPLSPLSVDSNIVSESKKLSPCSKLENEWSHRRKCRIGATALTEPSPRPKRVVFLPKCSPKNGVSRAGPVTSAAAPDREVTVTPESASAAGRSLVEEYWGD